MRSDVVFCIGTQEIVPFMLAVSRLLLVFDAVLMVKKDLSILMDPCSETSDPQFI